MDATEQRTKIAREVETIGQALVNSSRLLETIGKALVNISRLVAEPVSEPRTGKPPKADTKPPKDETPPPASGSEGENEELPQVTLAELQELGATLLKLGGRNDLMALLEAFNTTKLSNAKKEDWPLMARDLRGMIEDWSND